MTNNKYPHIPFLAKWLILLLVLAQPNIAESKTIVVLGDSLSAAYGIAREQGWVALLQDRLRQRQSPYSVINESISGDTTAGGLARLPGIITRHQMDLLVIELGANDGLRGYPLTQMKRNLKQMVQLAQQTNAEVLLLGIEIPANYGKRYKDGFKQVYIEVAEEEKVPLLPSLLVDVPLEEEYFLDDRLHPSTMAQPLIMESVWHQLTKLL